jgi:putative hydrolase of the HAD superfamily
MRLRAIAFDYGGTLDGGVHWLERFVQLYSLAGLDLPFERVRAAFDHATRCAYADPAVAEFGLEALIHYHVARQMEHLVAAGEPTARARDAVPPPVAAAATIVAEFVSASRAGLADSRVLLSRLRQRFALGVVSNFYGNVHRVLDEAELTPLLATIVDSSVVGVRKPDPVIFTLAVERLGVEPAEVLYVGDSFEKDIVGAHAAGLRTAWLTGAAERPCGSPECVDARLRSLADLEPLLASWQDDGARHLSSWR